MLIHMDLYRQKLETSAQGLRLTHGLRKMHTVRRSFTALRVAHKLLVYGTIYLFNLYLRE